MPSSVQPTGIVKELSVRAPIPYLISRKKVIRNLVKMANSETCTVKGKFAYEDFDFGRAAYELLGNHLRISHDNFLLLHDLNKLRP